MTHRLDISLIKTFFSCIAATLILVGCNSERPMPTATRTPFLTFTPTALLIDNSGAQSNTAPVSTPSAERATPPLMPTWTPTETPTIIPVLTATFTPPAPISTPTPEPLDIPTEIPAPTVAPTPEYEFILEAAEKFPTNSFAADVLRVDLYVYSEESFTLPGYTLRIIHDGELRSIEGESTGGLPQQTRSEAGPYTRFTNMSRVVVTDSQAGIWAIQLIDLAGVEVGPMVIFELTAEEDTRELYVRYRKE